MHLKSWLTRTKTFGPIIIEEIILYISIVLLCNTTRLCCLIVYQRSWQYIRMIKIHQTTQRNTVRKWHSEVFNLWRKWVQLIQTDLLSNDYFKDYKDDIELVLKIMFCLLSVLQSFHQYRPRKIVNILHKQFSLDYWRI